MLNPVGGKLWAGGTLEQVQVSLSCRVLTLLPLCLQCFGRDVNVLIDTGCRFNLMSSSTVERLGSVDHVSVQQVEALVQPQAWSFVSVQKSEGSGGGGQRGGGSPVPEKAFCGRTDPRAGPDCRPAQSPLLLCYRRWESKDQRSKWTWWPTRILISLLLSVLRK